MTSSKSRILIQPVENPKIQAHSAPESLGCTNTGFCLDAAGALPEQIRVRSRTQAVVEVHTREQRGKFAVCYGTFLECSWNVRFRRTFLV